MFNKKYGSWIVNNIEFDSKFNALVYASRKKATVKFNYHDNVWTNFDRSQLGKYSLNSLYKERALQLRDRYEYLILYYSGGSDSHNVLRTFVDNKIKLDEICVKWPKPLLEGKFHQPNLIDRTARNYWSEWDYAIRPVLEQLKQTNPEILITIKDYTENIDNIKFDKIFDKVNHVRSGAMLYSSAMSDSQFTVRKKIGHIYGIDKPLLAEHENTICMFFSDLPLSLLHESETDTDNTEAFYWAPDFPILTFEMAYQNSHHFITSVDNRKFLWFNENDVESSIRTQYQNDLTKSVCYTTWDYRFQADKPLNLLRSDKWFWFFEHPEFKKILKVYNQELQNRVLQLSERFLDLSAGNIPGIITIPSNLYFIRNIDK